MLVKTFKYRIKDSVSKKKLDALASSVNLVWNYSVYTSKKHYKRWHKILSKFDLNNLTSGSSKELDLHSQTVQAICEQFVKSSKQHKKFAKFRSFKRNLGWIPFKACAIKIEEDSVFFNKYKLKIWKSRELQGKIKTGCFTKDSQGRWYVCISCEVEQVQNNLSNKPPVGVDLGLKTKLTLSDCTQYSRENLTNQHEDKLALAQRANKAKQVKKIHSKIKNKREDWSHKTTSKIANDYSKIVVGDIESTKIVNTNSNLAKSVYDASWFQIKQLLKYKAQMLGVEYVEVNEAYTTKTCSECGKRSGPSGVNQLDVREWFCEHCGTVHDRDINAARNILRRGHATLKESGIPVL